MEQYKSKESKTNNFRLIFSTIKHLVKYLGCDHFPEGQFSRGLFLSNIIFKYFAYIRFRESLFFQQYLITCVAMNIDSPKITIPSVIINQVKSTSPSRFSLVILIQFNLIIIIIITTKIITISLITIIIVIIIKSLLTLTDKVRYSKNFLCKGTNKENNLINPFLTDVQLTEKQGDRSTPAKCVKKTLQKSKISSLGTER